MPDANGYPYPWEPGYQLGQGTATAAAPTPTISVPVPQAQNIDPNAGRQLNPYGTVGEPAANTAQGPQYNAPPTQPKTVPGTNYPVPDPLAGIGNAAVDAITQESRQGLANAHAQLNQTWGDLSSTLKDYNAETDYTKREQLNSRIQTLYVQEAQQERNIAGLQTQFASTLD